MAKSAYVEKVDEQKNDDGSFKRLLVYWQGKNSPDGVIDKDMIQTIRTALANNLPCAREYEKKGNYFNLTKVGMERNPEHDTLPSPEASVVTKPEKPQVAPQAVGMITKEIGDNIRAGTLSTIFGAEIANSLLVWYRSQTLGITQINFDGKDLPKFK